MATSSYTSVFVLKNKKSIQILERVKNTFGQRTDETITVDIFDEIRRCKELL